MEVHGTGSVGASIPVQFSRPTAEVDRAASTAPTTPKDEVQISEAGKMLDDISRTPGVREQRLAQIKAAIENGTYETPDKLDLALSRMMDQIAHDINETR